MSEPQTAEPAHAVASHPVHSSSPAPPQPAESQTSQKPPPKATTARDSTPKTQAPPMKTATAATQQKKVSRRSSKPIINWFQRKLAGSGKTKRMENVPLTVAQLGVGRGSSTPNRQMGRITSSPLPVPSVQHMKQSKTEASTLGRKKTRSISLNGDEEVRDFSRQSYLPEDDISERSSLNRESIWSPASALEADDDASLRPIPPSAPPSPSPSRDSSSYLSDPRTFRSMAASTKPTTLLSIDLNGGGMAHIAQALPSQATPFHRFAPHVRQSSSLSNAGLLSSGASITFSALPNAQTSSRPASVRSPGSLGSISAITQGGGSVGPVQAPLHTAHHPRNNPRPSSPPLDNASVLTLASSAFGFPNRPGLQNYAPSAVGDTVSQYGGSAVFPDGESMSHYVLGEDERLEERDFDASVRALRPRSSRRGSWESEASRWSARVQGPGTGTPSLARERSLWTSNSVRTGGFSVENGEAYETADDRTPAGDDDSEKGFHLEPPDSGNRSIPSINEPSENSLKSDDVSSTAPSQLTGANESDMTHNLHRASTDTIAQAAVRDDLSSVNVEGRKLEEDSEGSKAIEDIAVKAKPDTLLVPTLA